MVDGMSPSFIEALRRRMAGAGQAIGGVGGGAESAAAAGILPPQLGLQAPTVTGDGGDQRPGIEQYVRGNGEPGTGLDMLGPEEQQAALGGMDPATRQAVVQLLLRVTQ